jgi:hypothetical protein
MMMVMMMIMGHEWKRKTVEKDPRWWLGLEIRNPKLCDTRHILEISELHLGNSDCL